MKKYSLILCALLCWYVAAAQQKDTLGSAWKYPPALQQELNKWGISIMQGGICADGFRKGIYSWQEYSELPPNQMYPFEPKTITDSMAKKLPGDINIYWVHGLNGNTESLHWPAYATQYGIPAVFDARKARSVRGINSSSANPVQFYSEDAGIRAAAADLDNTCTFLVPPAERKKEDFIIAHSQGGIVAREWLRRMDQDPTVFSRFANGLVTFGSPHAGATVINRTRADLENRIPVYMQYACQSLGNALISKKVKDNFLLRMAMSSSLKNQLANMACSMLSETVIPLALDNYFKRTTLDFYEGAPFLNGFTSASGQHTEGLSEYKQTVPVVQFYGVEEQPVLWRFLSSTMHIGQDKMDGKEAAFGYDEDSYLQGKVETLINDFDANAEEQAQIARLAEGRYIGMLATALATSVFSPVAGAAVMAAATIELNKCNKAKNDEKSYKQGSEWLRNANITYQMYLIGARVTPVGYQCTVTQTLQCRDPHYNPVGSGVPAIPVTITRNYYTPGSTCNETNGPVLLSSYHFSGYAGENLCGDCVGDQVVVKTWKNEYSFEPNDGVVLARSASWPVPLATGVLAPAEKRFIVLLENVNHEQMKNCKATKYMLNRLYNGEFGNQFLVRTR